MFRCVSPRSNRLFRVCYAGIKHRQASVKVRTTDILFISIYTIVCNSLDRDIWYKIAQFKNFLANLAVKLEKIS